MKKQVTALITAALILANFTACNSNTEPIENLSNDSSEISNNSEENSSEPEISQVSQIPDEEPTFLKGPDGKPIYPSEITFAVIKDENAPNGERRADISELTEDNLSFVSCGDFVYLREPTGKSYNRYESPEKFESEFPYLYIGGELVNQNPIKRVYIGEKICGMTVTDGATVFADHMRDSSVPFWSDLSTITFKGEITLTGYLSVEAMTPDYPGTEGLVTFWLDEESSPLPTVALQAGENGAESRYCAGTGFYAEYYDIVLGSIYDSGQTDLVDGSLLDGITYGDKDVHVKITIDGLKAVGSGNSKAVLKSLERL